MYHINFINGFIKTAAGKVPAVNDFLSLKDYLGAIMVRWGINRNNYMVEPGLYAIGKPDEKSNVFVTANYKLSFDILRKNINGLNAWILVLDTKGVNVWCAAGKGTFGTKELVERIKLTSLESIVNHKKLILPQLGAVGVAAHSVKEMSGFSVRYGPVRASDIKEFINNNYKASPEMRAVKFDLSDRIKLTPVDFINWVKYVSILFIPVYLFTLFTKDRYMLFKALIDILPVIRNMIIAVFAGSVLTPALLPYLPAKSFAIKGFIVGIGTACILYFLNLSGNNLFEIISWFIFTPALSSFVAMNFTGSSTYTSLSGVKKEMKFAIPVQIALTVAASLLAVIKTIMQVSI